MPDYTLRDATEADFEFLYTLHAATIQEYVVQVWGKWDDQWQRDHYKTHKMPPTDIQIVVVNGEDVGMFQVEKYDDHHYLDLIEIHPDWQNQGLATTLIQQAQNEAQQANKPIKLRVLKVNPAQHLYQRLGFEITSTDDLFFNMAWQPLGK